MSTLQIGRLVLGQPSAAVGELLGDPIGNTGGAIVPAPRTPYTLTIQLNTLLNGTTTTAQAQALRRQLRSLLNNTPLKLQGFLYLIYGDDPELNAWVVPDPTTLQGRDSTSFLVGLWEGQASNWSIVGRTRSHREARSIWMKDLRGGLNPRDYRGWIYSTDFSALPALPLTVLPNGVTGAIQAVSAAVVLGAELPAGRDGGVCQIVRGLTDLQVVSYERPEGALNLSDVIVYDRMGQLTAPAGGPDTSWQELYGPDWPYNWLTAGQPHDTPVLDNGLIRVRYDASVGKPGFRIDVWNGTAYVEQGKVNLYRAGDFVGVLDTWLSARLAEWTPDRAVMQVVLATSVDPTSHDYVIVTVQRGLMGATFEIYPALSSTGYADGAILYTPAATDANDSFFVNNSQATPPSAPGSGQIAATAGTGSSHWTTTGYSFASAENWAALLSYSATATLTAYQTNFQVQQAAGILSEVSFDSAGVAYGVARNQVFIGDQTVGGLGYVQVAVAFAPTRSQQVLEVESMTLGSGTVSTADANASGGFAATATRTSDANAHATQSSWPGFAAQYRIWARVKVSAGTGSFYCKLTGGTANATVTTIQPTYVWLDLGEVTTGASSTLELHAWLSTAGTVYVDRVEAVLTQDRVRTGAIFSGARDRAQAVLYDSRQLGAIVARG